MSTASGIRVLCPGEMVYVTVTGNVGYLYSLRWLLIKVTNSSVFQASVTNSCLSGSYFLYYFTNTRLLLHEYHDSKNPRKLYETQSTV